MRASFIASWIGIGILGGVLTVTAVIFTGGETWTAVLIVAALEGLCLGALQGALIRTRCPVPGWFAATAAGVVVGRSAQFALETGPWMTAVFQRSHADQLIGGAFAGMLVGGLTAGIQALALRRSVRAWGWWIAARGVSTAVAFVFLGAMQFTLGYPDVPFATIFAILAGVAAIAASLSAAIDAPVMLALLRPAGRRRSQPAVTAPASPLRSPPGPVLPQPLPPRQCP